MNALPGIILIAVTLSWFVLPLIPAIAEFLRPSDIAPLRVVPRDAGDVAFLAKGFRQYLSRQTDSLPPGTPADFIGKLPDGTLFTRTRTGQLPAGNNGRPDQDRVVLIDGAIVVGQPQTFRQEVRSTDDFQGAADSAYRALLGEAAVTIGERSRVLRWIHAVGPLTVGKDSVLQGRVSSDHSVTLSEGIIFDRIGAPSIHVTGRPSQAAAEPAAAAPFTFPEHSKRVGAYTRIEGDLEVPANVRVEGDLVVTGRLTLGAGAVINGSAKVHGPAVLEAGAQVLGSLVGVGEIGIGADVSILGPLIAEGSVNVGPGSRIGTPERVTTLVADSMVLGDGVSVFGQVIARSGGRTQS